MSLLKDGYSYQWRSPGWIVGPIFLAGGVLVLGAGVAALHGDQKLTILGAALALIGLTITSASEGIDYAPLTHTVVKWSRRFGVRSASPAVKLKNHWVAVRPRPNGKTAEVCLCSETDPHIVLLGSRPQEQAVAAATKIAKSIKLEVRDSVDGG